MYNYNTIRAVPFGQQRKGVVIVMVAVLLVVMLGCVALAVDIGYLYVARTELQRTADAAALAGARALGRGSSTPFGEHLYLEADVSAEQAVQMACQKVEGAYGIVVICQKEPDKLIAARDPYGFKPLSIGKLKDSYLVVLVSMKKGIAGNYKMTQAFIERYTHSLSFNLIHDCTFHSIESFFYGSTLSLQFL